MVQNGRRFRSIGQKTRTKVQAARVILPYKDKRLRSQPVRFAERKKQTPHRAASSLKEQTLQLTGLEEIPDSVYAYGFERPSAIQQRAILPIIKSKSRNQCILLDLPLINCFRQRCHRSGSVRYRKDRYFLHLCSAEARPQRQGLPGSDCRSHP
ncbi:hypothetical protein ASPVEDRAFT_550407 [Aspergillus versicolor CBS 583.65]|uniref:DEAD-box RNA helicase Q domain-containing protein n=1 Tax=Aspergillus versicolor CBS 583.65 TaxID=1036611 RepID=A0A1L9PFE1_ASPVE|nr:uncharacterized protein ASPVEDRAFT_550407 [Aspergillus versicolor CBS 583.65]OJJ00165.1 hypothetical protein ASPVEDRAFT_550407 [Aspergillus versicolor CBS 583.65]